MKVAIDTHLGAFSSAVRHLVAAGESHFGEAVAIAKREGLLKELLGLVRGKEAQEVEVRWGETWLSGGSFGVVE